MDRQQNTPGVFVSILVCGVVLINDPYSSLTSTQSEWHCHSGYDHQLIFLEVYHYDICTISTGCQTHGCNQCHDHSCTVNQSIINIASISNENCVAVEQVSASTEEMSV
jgi:hypothetical protein